MDYPQEHIKPYGEDGKKSEQVEELSLIHISEPTRH